MKTQNEKVHIHLKNGKLIKRVIQVRDKQMCIVYNGTYRPVIYCCGMWYETDRLTNIR